LQGGRGFENPGSLYFYSLYSRPRSGGNSPENQQLVRHCQFESIEMDVHLIA
jgi:hypothetical protein